MADSAGRVFVRLTTLLAPPMLALAALSCAPTASTSEGASRITPAVAAATPASTATPVHRVTNEPYPTGTVGYAISWPQCGGPYPEEPFDFGIVGVTDARALTRNPCFADEYRWAKHGRFHPSIYMNVNYRESADDFPGWWPCDDASCRAYRYGLIAADDAYEYASSFDAVAPVWWLDVQIVSDWSPDLSLNADAIRGAADYLKAKGIRVGISSTSYQWANVAGEAKHDMPVWDASATDADEATAFCPQGKDFGGGHTEQIAYVAGGFEVVLACGGERHTDGRQPGIARELGWWGKYANQDVLKERYDQEINGILIGPTVEHGVHEACLRPDSNAGNVPLEQTEGSELDFRPEYLPPGVEFVDGYGTACGDTLIFLEKNYVAPYIPSEDPDVPFQTGGAFAIRRFLMPNDSLDVAGAAERFSGATIQGKPSVVVRPVLPDGIDAGFFQGTIVMQETDGFTIIQGDGVPWLEFFRIAENLR